MQARAGAGVDTLALSTTEGAMTAGPMRFSGRYALVRELGSDLPRWALVAGTELACGDLQLLSSDAPVTVGAVTDEGVFRASVRCETAAVVTMRCPTEPGMVRLNGVDQPVDVSFDQAAGTVRMALPPGSYELEVRGL